uniref:Uncharacterized protein n=1 Tax=Anopheles stephensi TaxID=30069 RepID=A0A182YPP5_ANOST
MVFTLAVANKVFGAFGTLPKNFPTPAVTVNEDVSVPVPAEEAHPVEDLDSSACRELLSNAQS